MKREIKFRGKSTDTGKWVYGFLSFFYTAGRDENGLIFTDKAKIYSPEDCRCDDVWAETVGEFAGLYDKSRKEIYEGDIVKWIDSDGNERQDVVTWMNGGLCLCNSSYTVGHYGNIEVIGNIHENPELLKGGNQ